MRKRFRTSRICSSDDPKGSMKLSRFYEQEGLVTLKIQPKYYAIVFGKEVQVDNSELHKYSGFKIIQK